MKFAWLAAAVTATTLLALFVNAKPKTIAGLCIPQSVVVNHNIAQQDANFDQDDERFVATLMFPPEQVQQAIAAYSSTTRNKTGSELRQPLHATLSKKAPKQWSFNEQHARQLQGHATLFTDTDEAEFSWQVHEKTDVGFQYWGSCMDDFNGGFGCFRQLNHDTLYLSYSVEAANLALYQQLDTYLRQQLLSWQCQQ